MRLLLDESVPRRFRLSLAEHDVRTVVDMGWAGMKNGELLSIAAKHFDAFITVDKNLPCQQNLNKLPLTVIVLESMSNELASLLPLVPALKTALVSLEPRTCLRVALAG
jgi:hypothetical protein